MDFHNENIENGHGKEGKFKNNGRNIDDDDEGEEEEEDEEEEEEEEYQLRFEGQIDPLKLADEDEAGAHPYQQFQKLELEALAARKRRALQSDRRDEENAKKLKYQELYGASVDEIWEAAGFGVGRRRRSCNEEKRRGRPKKRRILGVRGPKVSPEVTKKLGDANLSFAMNKSEEALEILKEVVRLAPNLPDPYHTLGLVYNNMGNKKKAMNFYLIAAHLTPKDAMLWKRLASMSMEQGISGQVIYCLQKAVIADPEDVHVKWELASLYANLKNFKEAAELLEQILALHPSEVEICKKVAKMQHSMGLHERATQVLQKLIENHPTEVDLTVVELLASFYMEKKAFATALSCIEHARKIYCAGNGLPLQLGIKAGISHAYLGDRYAAEVYFEALGKEQAEEYGELVLEVGNTYHELKAYDLALKYYVLLDGIANLDNSLLWIRMAQCYSALKEETKAGQLYFRVLEESPDDVDVRLTLVSLLLEQSQLEEAFGLLMPPPQSAEDNTHTVEPWWENRRIKVKLANICQMQEKWDLFLDSVLKPIQETVYIEYWNQKQVKRPKRVPKSVLSERVKWLEENLADSIFHGFRPAGSYSGRRMVDRARRARKSLQKLEEKKEEKKVAVLAAGLEWRSEDDSDQETNLRVPPFPGLFDDDEHYQLILQTCKVLAIVERQLEALDIINQLLKIDRPFMIEKRNELRSLGAQIAYKAKDKKFGYNCVRFMVKQRPYSINAWNCYHESISSLEQRFTKHNKFMLEMRAKHPDCVPPMLMMGHHFSLLNQYHLALREYLHAYKTQPDDPFLNLCVGIGFINLSLGFRLTNRNQAILQGFAFLYNYQRLTSNTQESDYNIARAYHHVGLVHLAVVYYEKVLSRREKDHPDVKLDVDFFSEIKSRKESECVGKSCDYCDLRKEAAHNLHLIYKKSGAADLARQILRDFCS